MADIIDIFSKTKTKTKTTYYERRLECLHRYKEDGTCECEVCLFKSDIASKLIAIASSDCVKKMKDDDIEIFMGDLVDILIEAQVMAEEEISNPDRDK